MKKATKTGKTAIKVSAGLAAAGAAVAAGYYFYGSKKAKVHRKIATKWANDMKKEVIKEAKRLKSVSPKAFSATVDRVAKAYSVARSINSVDIKRAANELKANWKTIKHEANQTVKKSVSQAKKTGKRMVK
jgi:hypothetical protein